MYREELPDVDDVVMAVITRVTNTGVYATLPEYHIEGLIVLSEVSKQRWKRARKTVPVGRKTPVLVLRVDSTKSYVDLSKKRVTPSDAEACTANFSKSKTVHAILAHVCEESNFALREAYERFGWSLYGERGHAVDELKRVVTDPGQFFATYDVPAAVKNALVETCGRRLASTVAKIEAAVDVTCFAYAGIEAVKEALLAGASLATDELPLEVRLLATPRYSVRLSAVDVEAGLRLVDEACAAIKAKILDLGGGFALAARPAVSATVDTK